MAISKRIIENKETRKESRKYYVLRNIIRECFQRLVIEDFEYTLQEDLADYYVLTVVLDVSPFIFSKLDIRIPPHYSKHF